MRAIEGLRIDWNNGEGEIKLPARFLSESELFQADVLQDWIEQLTELYEQAIGPGFEAMRDRVQTEAVREIVHGKKNPGTRKRKK